MSKKFDIHEWQAKVKLAEQTMTNFGPVQSVTKYNGLPIRDNVMDYASEILNQINDYENNVGPGEQMIDYNATREAVRALMNAVDRDEEGMMEANTTTEALNPEVSQKVNAFIKAMAKRYDYSEQDAVFAIMAALKQRKTDEASTTGTGASFTPGTGAAYATPRAFGNNKRKKKKGYMGYKEI